MFSIGDTDISFSVQSCIKPIVYAAVVEDNGLEKVHKHVGAEPSGVAFNEVLLDDKHRPHNPMINAGAIATCSLYRFDLDAASRFRSFMDFLSLLAGGEKIGFSQETYLCEDETAWRNRALVHYMHDAGVFPKGSSPDQALDFYLQCCSIEVNTVSFSILASTFANGGVCPLTDVRGISPLAVKSMLTLMFSCGMYDYSGEWCVHVGLPAKSGVAGLIFVVIPHVMGIAVYAPKLDSHGNSVRGVEFYQRLLRIYPSGIFDQIVAGASHHDEVFTSGTVGSAEFSLVSGSGDEIMESDDIHLDFDKSEPTSPGDAPSTKMHTLGSVESFRAIFRKIHYLFRMCHLYSTLGAVFPPNPSSVAEVSFSDTKSPSDVKVLESLPRGSLTYEGLCYLLECKGYGTYTKKTFPSLFKVIERIKRVAERVTHNYIPLLAILAVNVKHNVVLKALLGKLAIPQFATFIHDIKEISRSVECDSKLEKGSIYSDLDIKELKEQDPASWGVSICTVDGQLASFGDCSHIDIPIMNLAKPFLYALALKHVGIDEVHRWVGTEPTSADPTGFGLLKSSGSHKSISYRKDHDITTDSAPSSPDLKHPKSEESDLDIYDIIDRSRTPAVFKTPEPERHSHPKPHNPFIDTGALTVCSVIGRAHYESKADRLFSDRGERFKLFLKFIQEMSGGRKIGFHNAIFLAQKQKALKTLSTSFYIKGMECYPESTDPTDNAHLFFQTRSVEATCETLATATATIANIGKCPSTLKQVMTPQDVRSLLSLTYSCGLNQFTGQWAFTVGIPAVTSNTGLMMIIIPNTMGIVIYSPLINSKGVPPKVVEFCRLLTKKYRVNIFEKLVYLDEPIGKMAEFRGAKEEKISLAFLFYQLMDAVTAGDTDKIEELIEKGADVTSSDYDKRSPLHIACSEGRYEVVVLLVKQGASHLAKDRWGNTPRDDALKIGASKIVAFIDAIVVPVETVEDSTKKGSTSSFSLPSVTPSIMSPGTTTSIASPLTFSPKTK